MPRNELRIPKRVTFPFQYVVKVVLTDDIHTLGDADGGWDVDVRTIYIRRNLPHPRRRYVLSHELLHAFTDWQHYCLDKGIMAS